MRNLLVACALIGCGSGGKPDILGLEDQVAVVGTEFVLQLDGVDPDGDRLEYDVSADIPLEGNASISQTPSGSGVFRWTPIAADVGVHAFDFSVTDGDNTTTVSIQIDVRSTSAGLPIFREPLGTGRVVNLATDPCVAIDILIEDQDSAEVTIAEEEPLITGAEFSQTDALTATWSWCPTTGQIAETDRYTLTLSADDGDNPKQTKAYVIVLGGALAANLVINEIDYDSIGSPDSSEYIELLNTTSSSLSLAGMKIALVNGAVGASGTVYQTIDLSSVGSLDAGQYLVLAQALVQVPAAAKRLNLTAASDQIQNGAPDGIALYDDVTKTLIDVLSYEGSITTATIAGFPATVSLVEGTVLDPATVYDINDGIRTLCRIPNGKDTNNANVDWTNCAKRSVGAANLQQ